ncbi:MAG TPA: DUF4326 domain-containing protein [Casimicrobiaceae bacterium]|nr:DUF4326 domain-containing protein [Casimicrobiaceae bacterium]
MRVQLSRKKGWRLPEDTVSVARPGRWGNPYDAREYGLDLALRLFENTARGYWSPSNVQHLDDPTAETIYGLHCAWRKRFGNASPFELARLILRGKNLACWCPLVDKDGKPVPCHADVLLRIANE